MVDRDLESLQQEAVQLLKEMSPNQFRIVLEALKIHDKDSSMTEDECLVLASKRLGIPLKFKNEVSA